MKRQQNFIRTVAIFYFLFAWLPATEATDAISLQGRWAFRLDPKGQGLEEQWQNTALPDKIDLPGALQAQGYGEDISVDTQWTCNILTFPWHKLPEYEKYRQPGNIKVPFWLQPDKHYVGAAWYQREIEIPQAWKAKSVLLSLERPHWETRAWVDGKEIGRNESLSTPHDYNLGILNPGKHRVTIRVDNRMIVEVGRDAHSVTDHTQGNWNGIVGKIELRPRDPIWIESQAIFPKNDGTVLVKLRIRSDLFDPVAGEITTSIIERKSGKLAGKGCCDIELPRGTRVDGSRILSANVEKEITVKLDRPPELWNEFNPELYVAESKLEVKTDSHYTAAATATFGFRELAAQGTQFTLNGQKIFFRGTLECCIFPLTGHPPTDVDSWKRIIRIAKAHGLNLLRFHSWCPPEAAFIAADELGFYYQVECAAWATVGDGKPIDKWLYEEADRILEAYGNHPSFLLMPYGNEPSGDKHVQYLAAWVKHFKEQDKRRLYTSASGWPQIEESQFHVTLEPRIHSWNGGLQARINARPPETRTDYREFIRERNVPVITHEMGQWCAFPNFEEIPKYRGPLKATNFEIFRETLAAHHLGELAKEFLFASGKLQTLCYKEDIEAALRTPGMGGFELLDLHDFPGQGAALVGVLDAFWDSKGYVTAGEYRRFCNSTVPLARMSKRVFTGDEQFQADLEVAHFGAHPLKQAVTVWKLVNDAGKTLLSGELPAKDVPLDNGVALGSVALDLKSLPTPAKYKFVVGIAGTPFENDWDIWVYPPKVDLTPPNDITIARELDDKTLAKLNAGGKVLLLIPPGKVRGDQRGKVALSFASIFWSTALFPNLPHTLGILCDPKDPALRDFPTEYHSNWQWWYLIHEAGAMILDDLPPELKPTVRVIDDWFTNRRLGLIFEAKIGGGKIMVCSIDLKRDSENNPVARQMLHSLLNYMKSHRFQPQAELKSEQIQRLFKPPSAMEKLGARVVGTDSFEPGYEPQNAIDGDSGTLWSTAWTAKKPDYPHEIRIEFERPVILTGITLLPRQDGNPNGWIKDYAVSVSRDGKDWGQPVAEGSLARDDHRKRVRFPGPIEVKFLRLAAKSGFDGDPFATLAELEATAEKP